MHDTDTTTGETLLAVGRVDLSFADTKGLDTTEAVRRIAVSK